MAPYTDKYQKTMIPIHGKPLLEYIVEGLMFAGFNDFILVVGYRKEQIIDYFHDGSKRGIKIEYIEQKELNGTGGALLLCEDSIIEQHFFLTWGDILVPYKIYEKVHDAFRFEKNDFVLVTNYLDDPYKGCAIYCEGNYCVNMVEKPPKGSAGSDLNNCGIFIFSKKIFEILKVLKPSERGEIEIPEAICNGINERNWKVRVVKMERNQFRGDFGDLDVFETLKKDSSWLEELF